LNSRERILAAINHEKVDRIPTDIWATPEVWQKLVEYFGEGADIRAALHIDGFAGVGAAYVGPLLPEAPPGETVDMWGIRTRSMEHGTGTYNEQYYFPLADAKTIDDLDRYPWPKPDWFDYSKMREGAKALHEHHAVQFGYMAPFYYHNLLRGLEQSLMDPLEDPELTHEILRRIGALRYRGRFGLEYFPKMKAGREYRPITEEELKRTSVYAIKIEAWSGKENWNERADQSGEWPALEEK